MSYEFTTIQDCENRIKKFKQEQEQEQEQELEILKDLGNIQFPIADNEDEQFNHLCLNDIIYAIEYLEDGIID